MAGTNFGCTELLRQFKRLDPLLGVAIANVVVGTVHASVASEEDFLFRQPCEAIAMCMSYTKMKQFNTMPSIVETHVLVIEQRRRVQFACSDGLTPFGGVLPASRFVAIITRLIFLHLSDDA